MTCSPLKFPQPDSATVRENITKEQEVGHIKYCDVIIRVVDSNGHPIENDVVDVNMQPEEIWEYNIQPLRTDADREGSIENWCGDWQFQVDADGYERITEDR